MNFFGRQHFFSNSLRRQLLIIGSVIVLSACGGGGGGDVGYQDDDLPPEASAQAVGLGASTASSETRYSARANTQVILTGKDSSSDYAPILEFEWKQISGTPTVTLIERTTAAVAFDAPNVADSASLVFELTVTDANGSTDTDSLTIDIAPIADGGRFLVDPNNPDSELRILAALQGGDTTGTSEQSITIEVITTVFYTNREGEPDQLLINTQTLNALFPANFSPAIGYQPITEPRNPIITAELVPLDADDINQNYQDDNRQRRLEVYNISTAYLQIQINVVDNSGVDFELFALDADGNAIDGNDIVATSNNDSTAGTNKSTHYGSASIAVAPNGALLQTWNNEFSASLLTTNILDELNLENAVTAANYYALIDPGAQRSTLSGWLLYAGFVDAAGNTISDPNNAHALYLNNYDLGFGRDMNLRKDENGNVYTYVTNYPTLEAGLEGRLDFAVVAMEYSENPDPNGPEKIVKFFGFVPDERTGEYIRVGSLNFDGNGEKFVPGVCTVCHQSNPGSRKFTDVADADLNATFIPWDLDSLLYTHANNPNLIEPTLNTENFDDATIEQFSMESQEEEFRKLNLGALATYLTDPERHALSIQLVHGWYGDPDVNLPVDQLPEANFDGSFVQAGWVGQEELYHDVFARTCRICHTQLDSPTTDFDSYDEFINKSNLVNYVFERGIMPMARLSMDRFWVDFDGGESAASALQTHFAGLGTTVPESPGLPVPAFSIGLETPSIDDVVILDASASAFSETYEWSLVTPSNSSIDLSNFTGVVSSFNPDVAGGSYDVQLTVTNENGDRETLTQTVTVIDRSPVASCFSASSSSLTSGGLLAGIAVVSTIGADAEGDGGLTLDSVIDGALGIATIDAGSQTVSYQLNDPFSRGLDRFSYQLVDADGSLSTTDTDCITSPTAGFGHITVDSSPAGTLVPVNVTAITDGTNDTFEVDISWDPPTSVTPDSYKLFRDSTEIADQTTRTYTDSPLTHGTTYSYTVKTIIGAFESNDSTASMASTLSLVPQNLTGTSISPSQIDLDWNPPAGNFTGYNIYRDDGMSNTIIESDYIGALPYSDMSVMAGTSYNYTVTALDASPQESGPSNIVSNTAKPNPPASVTATASSTTQIDLVWPAVTDATSYDIYRKETANLTFPGSTIGSPGTNSFSDSTGLVAGKSYDYRVGATVGGEDSITFASDSETTVPSTPTLLSAIADAPSQTTITVTWTPIGDSDVTGYDIFYAGNSTAIALNQSGTSYPVGGLTEATSYDFEIRAVAGGNRSALSNQVSGATFPATPTGVSAVVNSATQITVSWTNVAGRTYEISGDVTDSTPSNPRVFTGLTSFTNYSFNVIATANTLKSLPASTGTVQTEVSYSVDVQPECEGCHVASGHHGTSGANASGIFPACLPTDCSGGGGMGNYATNSFGYLMIVEWVAEGRNLGN